MIGNENFTSQESGTDVDGHKLPDVVMYVNASIPMHLPTCGRVLYSMRCTGSSIRENHMLW